MPNITFTNGVFGVIPGGAAYRSDFGASVNQREMTVTASAVIQVGDIVSASSGSISQAISLPGSNNSGSLSGGAVNILGIALANFTANASGVDTSQPGVNRTTCTVALFDPNLDILLPLYNATATSATYANITQYTSYQFGRWRGATSAIWWYYISETTTNGEFQYTEQYGLSDTYITSTWQYPPVWLRANQAYRQGGN